MRCHDRERWGVPCEKIDRAGHVKKLGESDKDVFSFLAGSYRDYLLLIDNDIIMLAAHNLVACEKSK